MKTTEIKALYAGAGKTTLLVKLFLKSKLEKKFLLSPSNKGVQTILRKLKELSSADYTKNVMTLRKFKRNYIRLTKDDRVTYLTVQSDKKYTKKPYNLFIDEASMLSDFEIQDLIQNFPIDNLVLDGDINQFEPIGESFSLTDAEKNVLEVKTGKQLQLNFEGLPYSLKPNKTVLLTKQMRSTDPDLVRAIQYIKDGDIWSGLVTIYEKHKARDCENKETDWHIAYTKKRCKELNSMYKNPKRFIVKENQSTLGFYKGEIYEIVDGFVKGNGKELDLEKLNTELIATDKKPFEVDDYFQPAYAINAHKLQGETLDNGDIFIHMLDILEGMRHSSSIKPEDLRKTFHKYIYVAVTRATSCQQINLFDFDFIVQTVKSLSETLDRPFKSQEEADEVYEDWLYYKSMLEQDPFVDHFENYVEYDYSEKMTNELVPTKDVALENKVYEDWNKKMYNDTWKKHWKEANIGKHNKPHKPHKPHSYPPILYEVAMTDITERLWTELGYGSNTLLRKLRKQLKRLERDV